MALIPVPLLLTRHKDGIELPSLLRHERVSAENHSWQSNTPPVMHRLPPFDLGGENAPRFTWSGKVWHLMQLRFIFYLPQDKEPSLVLLWKQENLTWRAFSQLVSQIENRRIFNSTPQVLKMRMNEKININMNMNINITSKYFHLVNFCFPRKDQVQIDWVFRQKESQKRHWQWLAPKKGVW